MIDTTRLQIVPLTHPQLVQYMQQDPALMPDLDLLHPSPVLPPELIEALEESLLALAADPAKNYLYGTLWTIILKPERKIVGDLCLQGGPNPAGEIEIGYGTYDTFQNRGFMTEAVGGMVRWAKTRPDLQALVAFTLKSNVPSGRILEKNGFVQCGETETMLAWRIKLRED